MQTRNYDDWTIDRWRVEPHVRPLDIEVDDNSDNPPLWKDVSVAAVIASVFWAIAAVILT